MPATRTGKLSGPAPKPQQPPVKKETKKVTTTKKVAEKRVVQNSVAGKASRTVTSQARTFKLSDYRFVKPIEVELDENPMEIVQIETSRRVLRNRIITSTSSRSISLTGSDFSEASGPGISERDNVDHSKPVIRVANITHSDLRNAMSRTPTLVLNNLTVIDVPKDQPPKATVSQVRTRSKTRALKAATQK